ncbi:MAG: NAD(P)/FAD-dependent oxidoreductase [Actinomycetota bacterium]
MHAAFTHTTTHARTTDVVVIGAGQAGLAMSYRLGRHGIDHVVLERGVAGNAWHTERWASLRLLSPNWLNVLPGASRSADPDAFMSALDFAVGLTRHAANIGAPIHEGCTVRSVDTVDDGFDVRTTAGTWRARSVVIAAGAFGAPKIPAVSNGVPQRIRQITPTVYRDPSSVAAGGVLVVGSSASGIQLADELRRAGRDVVVATGEHTRLPRRYRGMDIHWWMRHLGVLDQSVDEIDDLVRARRTPAPQLVGSTTHRSLDLNALQSAGVDVVGRMVGCDDRRAQFSGSLANMCVSADLKMNRMLDAIDEHIERHGMESEFEAADRPAPTTIPEPCLQLDLRRFDTIVWATGFRPHVPYLEADLLDRKGAIIHDGGVLPRPGLFALGLPLMRRRWSHFIGGVGTDAAELLPLIGEHLDATALAFR